MIITLAEYLGILFQKLKLIRADRLTAIFTAAGNASFSLTVVTTMSIRENAGGFGRYTDGAADVFAAAKDVHILHIVV